MSGRSLVAGISGGIDAVLSMVCDCGDGWQLRAVWAEKLRCRARTMSGSSLVAGITSGVVRVLSLVCDCGLVRLLRAVSAEKYEG